MRGHVVLSVPVFNRGLPDFGRRTCHAAIVSREGIDSISLNPDSVMKITLGF
jgi:phosphoenolpyruvate synthase/pyruvate phosphate dikinase